MPRRGRISMRRGLRGRRGRVCRGDRRIGAGLCCNEEASAGFAFDWVPAADGGGRIAICSGEEEGAGSRGSRSRRWEDHPDRGSDVRDEAPGGKRIAAYKTFRLVDAAEDPEAFGAAG